jgi:Rad3-related DNA helicase
MTLPSPSQLLGIDPSTFPGWYPHQEEAFSKLMDWFHSPKRFMGAALPTGAGKTIDALLLANLSGARTVILTATRGLQDQYLRDAIHIQGVLAKGQNNFDCPLVHSLRADEGPCHDGVTCTFAQNNGCPYRAHLKTALNSKLVITNYAYWLAQTNFSTGLGDVGLLILDEAHTSGAFSALENFLTIFIGRMDIESHGLKFPSIPIPSTIIRLRKGDEPSPPDLWAQWKSWAEYTSPGVDERVTALAADIAQLRDAGRPIPNALSRAYRASRSLLKKLSNMTEASGDWIIQETRHGFLFTPRWVAGYSHHLLHDIPKVLLMSAILSPKSVSYLGVPTDPANLDWLEAKSHFPPQNCQIWHLPTARINFRTDDYGTTIWLAHIDQLIQRRLDRKGIIFTVSYERARLLLSRSRYKDIMFTHSTGDVTAVINRFKQAKPPAILVSPSVTTGYDFPMKTCGQGRPQYAIVGKIPYPDTQNVVTQARNADDKEWTSYLAMETIVQESGRINRASEDLGEIFVLDDAWKWYYPAYKKFAPEYFRERVRGLVDCVPDPIFPITTEDDTGGAYG